MSAATARLKHRGVDAVESGSPDLQLPEELRGPLREHLEQLRQNYLKRGWGGRVGFGERPAVLVIDLARYWLDASLQIGSRLDAVVDATCRRTADLFVGHGFTDADVHSSKVWLRILRFNPK